MSSQQNSEEEAKSAVYRSDPNQSVEIQSVNITGAGNVIGSTVQSGNVTIKTIAQVAKGDNYFEVKAKTIESFEKVRDSIMAQAESRSRTSLPDLNDAMHALHQALQRKTINEKEIYFLFNAIGELSIEGLELLMKWLVSQNTISPHVKELAARALSSARRTTKK